MYVEQISGICMVKYFYVCCTKYLWSILFISYIYKYLNVYTTNKYNIYIAHQIFVHSDEIRNYSCFVFNITKSSWFVYSFHWETNKYKIFKISTFDKIYIYIYITYGWKCEKGYSEYAETRGDYFSHPRLWDGITVSDCGYSNLKERKNFFPLEKFNFDRFRKIKKTRTTWDLNFL